MQVKDEKGMSDLLALESHGKLHAEPHLYRRIELPRRKQRGSSMDELTKTYRRFSLFLMLEKDKSLLPFL
jgi:hypothetical protein